jgi:hypothetical protein
MSVEPTVRLCPCYVNFITVHIPIFLLRIAYFGMIIYDRGMIIDGRRRHRIIVAVSSPLLFRQVGSSHMHIDDVRILVDWHLLDNRDMQAALRRKEEELALERLKHQKLLATHRTLAYRAHRRLMTLKSQRNQYKERALHWYDRFNDYKHALIDVTGGYHREALKVSNAPYEQNVFHSPGWMRKRAKIHKWLGAAASKIDGPLPSSLD